MAKARVARARRTRRSYQPCEDRRCRQQQRRVRCFYVSVPTVICQVRWQCMAEATQSQEGGKGQGSLGRRCWICSPDHTCSRASRHSRCTSKGNHGANGCCQRIDDIIEGEDRCLLCKCASTIDQGHGTTAITEDSVETTWRSDIHLGGTLREENFHVVASRAGGTTGHCYYGACQGLFVEVEQQLTNVKAAKAKEDQLIMSQQAEQQLPDNRMAVTKMKDLLCLLPAEKAGDFGEMLNLLDGMLKEASGPAIHVVDSDSEMAPSECPVPQTPSASSLMAEVPAFPSAVVALADPYNGGGAITPRRRTRSESPRRSPGSRSRSTDNRRQCPMTNAFSRRELGGPFMG